MKNKEERVKHNVLPMNNFSLIITQKLLFIITIKLHICPSTNRNISSINIHILPTAVQSILSTLDNLIILVTNNPITCIRT